MKITNLFIVALCSIYYGQGFAQCGTSPTNASATYANNVTTFSWDAVAGASDYTIQIKQWFDQWPYYEYETTVNTNTLQLTGIMHSLIIDFRVKANCSGGSSNFEYGTITIPCPEPTNFSISNVTTSSAQLNWSLPAGFNTTTEQLSVSYRQYGSTRWIFAGYTQGTSYTLSNLSSQTQYEYCVSNLCAYTNSANVVGTFQTAGWCQSAGNNYDAWIRAFSLGSLSRNSGKETNGYSSNSNTVTLVKGSTYSGSISADFRRGSAKETFAVYIDFDNDGLFESNEKVYGQGTINKKSAAGFSVTVPTNVNATSTKMRVIMASLGTNIDGCLTNFNGETEDYNVIIQNANQNYAIPNQKGGVTTGIVKATGSIKVYPNPTHDVVSVDLSALENASYIHVTDLLGRIMNVEVIKGQSIQTIDFTKLPAGNYFLSVLDTDGNVIARTKVVFN